MNSVLFSLISDKEGSRMSKYFWLLNYIIQKIEIKFIMFNIHKVVVIISIIDMLWCCIKIVNQRNTTLLEYFISESKFWNIVVRWTLKLSNDIHLFNLSEISIEIILLNLLIVSSYLLNKAFSLSSSILLIEELPISLIFDKGILIILLSLKCS